MGRVINLYPSLPFLTDWLILSEHSHARASRQRPPLQELNPNTPALAPRRRRALTDAPIDEPAPRRRRHVRQPSVNVFEDPPVDPPIVRPFGFLSRLRLAPPHSLKPLQGCCSAYGPCISLRTASSSLAVSRAMLCSLRSASRLNTYILS